MVVHDGHEYLTEEERRLKEDREKTKYWKKWGPYVAERQWATGSLCSAGSSNHNEIAMLTSCDSTRGLQCRWRRVELYVLSTFLLCAFGAGSNLLLPQTSRTTMHDPELSDGVKMALPVSPIHMDIKILALPSGTRKSMPFRLSGFQRRTWS